MPPLTRPHSSASALTSALKSASVPASVPTSVPPAPDARQPAAPANWARTPLAMQPPAPAELRARWQRLHAGAPLPAPEGEALTEGWAAYHGGDFARAAAIGEAESRQEGRRGEAGLALLNQATAVYANYVEPREAARLALLRQVTERTQARLQQRPDDTTALYWHAYALGRHAQAVSVARALAQGLGARIKQSLERLLALQPTHADAHFALGAFHAEVIDKVGPLVGRMTYGAQAETAQALFERGLALHPQSASGLMEWARALLALHGPGRHDEATRLYQRAAAIEPADARERLDQRLARAGLEE